MTQECKISILARMCILALVLSDQVVPSVNDTFLS